MSRRGWRPPRWTARTGPQTRGSPQAAPEGLPRGQHRPGSPAAPGPTAPALGTRRPLKPNSEEGQAGAQGSPRVRFPDGVSHSPGPGTNPWALQGGHRGIKAAATPARDPRRSAQPRGHRAHAPSGCGGVPRGGRPRGRSRSAPTPARPAPSSPGGPAQPAPPPPPLEPLAPPASGGAPLPRPARLAPPPPPAHLGLGSRPRSVRSRREGRCGGAEPASKRHVTAPPAPGQRREAAPRPFRQPRRLAPANGCPSRGARQTACARGLQIPGCPARAAGNGLGRRPAGSQSPVLEASGQGSGTLWPPRAPRGARPRSLGLRRAGLATFPGPVRWPAQSPHPAPVSPPVEQGDDGGELGQGVSSARPQALQAGPASADPRRRARGGQRGGAPGLCGGSLVAAARGKDREA